MRLQLEKLWPSYVVSPRTVCLHQNSQDPTATRVNFTLCNESDHYYKSHYRKERRGHAPITGHACQALGKEKSELPISQWLPRSDTMIMSSIYRGKLKLQWVEHMSSVTNLGRPWTRFKPRSDQLQSLCLFKHEVFAVLTSQHKGNISREEARRHGGWEVAEDTCPNSRGKESKAALISSIPENSHITVHCF